MDQPLCIAPITPEHHKESFDCGQSGLNDFLLRRAHSPIYGNTYVVVPEPDSLEVIAFFTLSPDPIEIKAAGAGATQILTRFVKLVYLAVDKKHQGNGIGTSLLLYVMQYVAEMDDSRIKALALEPVDEAAWEWFRSRKYGFEYAEFPEPGLILPVESIRDALSNLPQR